ncbi:MAG: hypothetical protein ABSG18_26065, partial [Steroidobacteraceae bacterium]
MQVEGYPDAEVPSLQVVSSKATRHDIVMNAPAVAPAASPALAAAPKAAAPTPSAAAKLKSAVAAAFIPAAPGLRPAAPTAQAIPEALTSPDATEGVDNFTPFAFGDFTWLNGSPRNKEPVFDTKFFTPDIRFDAHYMDDFNHPKDHTIVGSTESFRSNEFQLEQVSLGG